MASHRNLAVLTGVLLILGVGASLVATTLVDSVLVDGDYSIRIAADDVRILWAVFFQLVTALGAAGIAISLYPVLKERHPGLALGAVGFRVIEGVFYGIAGLGLVALLGLGRGAPSGDISSVPLISNSVGDVRDASYFVFGVVAFGIGAALYYSAFYLTRIVPRWLTVWGFGGLILIVATALVTLFDGAPYSISGSLQILAIPIALQEIVLALWLIFRGFSVPE